MSDKRQYFKIEMYTGTDGPKGAQYRYEWRIVSIAGGDTVATGIPTKEYAEAMRQALEKELSK